MSEPRPIDTLRNMERDPALNPWWRKQSGRAADEIERLKNLREATEKWRIQTAEACERARDERDHYRDKYHECKAEIERLWAALERIEVRGLEIISEHVGGSDASYVAQELTAIAREALNLTDVADDQ